MILSFPFWKRQYQNLNTIELSQKALLHNYRLFQKADEQIQVAPVLKSNAYGHGLVEIARTLEAVHPPFFIVDSLFEAYELQKAKINSPILIMGFTHPDNFKGKKLHFSTVVYDIESIQVLYHYQPQMSLHLKIDTGMNRQGIRMDELTDFLQQLKQFPGLKIEGICSHLADADNPKSDAFTKQQIQKFTEAVSLVEKAGYHLKWKHLANTAGSNKVPGGLCNLIRLGLGLYGISPVNQVDLQPVLQLKSKLAEIKKIQPHELVGYNGTFTAKKEMTIGVLPIGYYDGVDRRLSNKGVVTIEGVACPIIGRVSMNMTTVDISQVQSPQVGQEVVIFSDQPKAQNSVEQAAKICKTIPYELLVHLNQSIKRVTV